jgi:NAD(P)-dependent dehydrogenase (short-subunit alcohol dehydrogenase family)
MAVIDRTLACVTGRPGSLRGSRKSGTPARTPLLLVLLDSGSATYQTCFEGAPMQPNKCSAAIVTGGGRGIGRAITLRLARSAPVIVVGRTEDDLMSVCAAIADKGGVGIPCTGDIADAATSRRAVELAQSNGWTVGHLVCNAGMGKGGKTETFPLDLWRRIFDVNLHGCFQFVQACLPQMLARSAGTITIMSSLAGVRGVAYDAAYTATKHALVGLARSLVLEYRGRGITTVALCPGFVAGEMTTRTIRGVMSRRGLSEALAEQRVASKCPAGRILPPEEVAEVIALIADGRLADAEALAGRGGYPLIYG